MSPPSPESELSYAPPGRPRSLTILGIFGIIFAAMGVVCVGGALTMSFIKTDPTMEHAPHAMMICNLALTVMGVVLSFFLMVASIGVLTLRPWSRGLMIVFAAVDLIFNAAKLLISLFYVLPIVIKLFETYPPPGITPEMMTFIRTGSIVQTIAIFVIVAAFDIVALFVMNKANAKAALLAAPTS